MKFIEIIQSAKSALYNVLLRLRIFCKRKHPPIVKENSEKSENQNPPDSPPEEKAGTADPPKQPQESQTSESSGTAKDAPPETPPDPPKEETPTPLDSSKKPKPQSENGQDKDSKERSDDPVKAPGKRGEEPKKPAEDGNRPAKPPRPQPPQCRFVCYEDNGRWVVALAIESGQNAQSVRQGKTALSANDCRYILDSLGAEVTVEFKGEHSSKSLKLFDEHNDESKFVVFKMRKNWEGEGQKVKTLSSGHYVVFAHKSCGQRINKEPPSEPGRCRYPEFTAHFFSVSEDSERDGFENCSLPFSSVKRFSLKGQRFPDDSDLGELFGDEAPQLIDAEEWREISWIVVGRENGGKVLAKFRPEEKTIEKMLAKVLGECSGWFFVRIYDAKVDLLHSFDFRRAKGLKNIFVNNQPLGEVAPIVPTKNGHTKTIVQFEGNLTVRPADDSDGIEPGKENAFAVSPQDNDGTKWVLSSGEECVEAEILLPRIWWKFIEEKGKEGDWQATPIEMERKAFCRAGNEEIRIRFSFCIPEIVVGFDDLNSPDNPTFRTKLSKDRKTREAEFRLDDFAFDQAIAKPLRKAIYLRVKLKDSNVVFPIVHIPADARPKPKPKPTKDSLEIGKGCNLSELKRAKEELYQEGRIAAAKAAGKFRAKGLKETILFDNIQKCLTIPFDPRRKSMEANNVEKLKAFFKKHFGKE